MPHSHPTTLSAWLTRRAEFSGSAPALTFDAQQWTYEELTDRAQRTATLFTQQGVNNGDRVAFLGLQSPEVLLCLFACSYIGAIFVPLNYRLSTDEIRLILNDCSPALLIADAEHESSLSELGSETGNVTMLLTGSLSKPSLWPILEDALTGKEKTISTQASADDIAAIVYTSGTTGTPKGVMLSHANLWSNNLNWNLAAGITKDDVILVTAPPFHVSGLFVLLTSVILMGGHAVLHNGFDAGAAIQAIEKHNVTITFMVPTMILMLTQHEEFINADLASLRLLVVGGAPTPEPLLRLCNERNIPVSHCYGMTECSSATTFLDPALATEKLNSVGLAMLLSEVKIIDASGSLTKKPGIKGEVCVRGGNVTSGYWQKSEATADLFHEDDWLRSGDIGYFDNEGYLYLCDRLKDMIISGGENVYPAEVESVLMSHPAIANAAVVGVPDAQWGERVTAVLILHPQNSLTLEELRTFCETKLARYKLPKELHLVKEFPLNGAGKVLKKHIRDSLLSTH